VNGNAAVRLNPLSFLTRRVDVSDGGGRRVRRGLGLDGRGQRAAARAKRYAQSSFT